MAAFAGVTADSVGQPGYAMERLQERPVEHAAAVFAAGRAVAEGLELVCSQKGEVKGCDPALKASSTSSSTQISLGFRQTPLRNKCTVPRSKIQIFVSLGRGVVRCGIHFGSVFHVVLSDRLGLAPVIMPQGFESDIAQMNDFYSFK